MSSREQGVTRDCNRDYKSSNEFRNAESRAAISAREQGMIHTKRTQRYAHFKAKELRKAESRAAISAREQGMI
jgi:hypothetical protein